MLSANVYMTCKMRLLRRNAPELGHFANAEFVGIPQSPENANRSTAAFILAEFLRTRNRGQAMLKFGLESAGRGHCMCNTGNRVSPCCAWLSSVLVLIAGVVKDLSLPVDAGIL
jgi:hypothetical protein